MGLITTLIRLPFELGSAYGLSFCAALIVRLRQASCRVWESVSAWGKRHGASFFDDLKLCCSTEVDIDVTNLLDVAVECTSGHVDAQWAACGEQLGKALELWKEAKPLQLLRVLLQRIGLLPWWLCLKGAALRCGKHRLLRWIPKACTHAWQVVAVVCVGASCQAAGLAGWISRQVRNLSNGDTGPVSVEPSGSAEQSVEFASGAANSREPSTTGARVNSAVPSPACATSAAPAPESYEALGVDARDSPLPASASASSSEPLLNDVRSKQASGKGYQSGTTNRDVSVPPRASAPSSAPAPTTAPPSSSPRATSSASASSSAPAPTSVPIAGTMTGQAPKEKILSPSNGASWHFNTNMLRSAVVNGDAGKAAQLLKSSSGCDMSDIVDLEGNGPLHWAVQSGQTQLLSLLLQHGLSSNARNLLGETPLVLAVRASERLQAVQDLLRSGADANLSDKFGGTPLMEAVVCGNTRLVRALLEARANPSQQSLLGQSVRDLVSPDSPEAMLLSGASVKYRGNAKAAEGPHVDVTPKVHGPQHKFCCVCQEPAKSQCSRCGKAFYCSKAHQQLDWREHKNICIVRSERAA